MCDLTEHTHTLGKTQNPINRAHTACNQTYFTHFQSTESQKLHVRTHRTGCKYIFVKVAKPQTELYYTEQYWETIYSDTSWHNAGTNSTIRTHCTIITLCVVGNTVARLYCWEILQGQVLLLGHNVSAGCTVVHTTGTLNCAFDNILQGDRVLLNHTALLGHNARLNCWDTASWGHNVKTCWHFHTHFNDNLNCGGRLWRRIALCWHTEWTKGGGHGPIETHCPLAMQHKDVLCVLYCGDTVQEEIALWGHATLRRQEIRTASLIGIYYRYTQGTDTR